MTTISKITPTPSEAEDWPLRWLYAEEIKAGDYLIDMGEFMKVIRVTTFEPLGAIQILARGDKSGAINYARTNRHRVHDQFWVLQKPLDN